MITTGVGFLAFITFYTALFLWAAKKYPLKLYKVFPPILIIYVVTMILFTCGAWTMTESVTATKTALVNNMVPAMVFLMCLNCNVKRILKLGPKLILTFFCATITICAGFCGFLCNFWAVRLAARLPNLAPCVLPGSVVYRTFWQLSNP